MEEGAEGASPPLSLTLKDLGEPMSQPYPHHHHHLQVSRVLRKERNGWNLRMVGREPGGHSWGVLR